MSINMMTIRKNIAGLIILAALAILSAGCNGLKIDSRWRHVDVLIDGSHAEWENALMYSDDKGVTIGFMNDNDDLYACLMAADEHLLMQSLMAGFTVWFGDMGKDRDTFGIKFPIGSTLPREGMSDDMPERNRHRGLQELTRKALENQNELEIIQGDQKTRLNFTELEDYGIDLKIGQYLGRLVYELKIPIDKADAREYAVVPRKNGTFKVGFEVGKMERREEGRHPPRDGEEFSGGMPPPGGGRGGRRGPHRDNSGDRENGLKFQIQVRLANEPASDK